MNEQPTSKQELYERIRETSKEEVILEEMIRLGFWPEQGTMPQDPTEEIRAKAQLEKELSQLEQENRRLKDKQKLLREIRKKRLAASKIKQKENKKQREEARKKRAAQWKATKERHIFYLGQQVSQGLEHKQNNPDRLKENGLPTIEGMEGLAKLLSTSVSELRFFAFSRKVSKLSHYIRFNLPKKTGGERLISAPQPRLKSIQYAILNKILSKIPVHEACHGFCKNRSIVTNALPHVNQKIMINLDLKDFFPTLTYKRVKGLFKALGYSEALATVLGLLCTEPEIKSVELDSQIWHIARGERFLPQGAPTSPIITNLICRRLDRRLQKLASRVNGNYSRYADDITLSGNSLSNQDIGYLLRQTQSIVEHEGFHIHPDKTKVIRHSRQQEVTGIVVNEKLNIAKKTLKRFRATLYQIEKDGPEGKQWGQSDDVLQAIEGYANFIYMVNKDKGAQFKLQVHRIKEKYGTTKSGAIPSIEIEEEKPDKWWKMF